MTHGPQLDAPLEDGLQIPGEADRNLPVGNRSRRRRRLGHGREHHAQGVARAGRRGRCHRAVELPVRGHHQQARAGVGDRQHRGAQAGARYAVQRHAARPAHRREDRYPSRCGQRRDGVGPLRRRGADALAEGRHDLVHRLDGGRQADHGEGRRDHEAAVPRTRRQVGDDRLGGRRLQHRVPHRHRPADACRPGLRGAHPDAAAALPLRRGRRDSAGHLREHPGRATRRTPAPSAVRSSRPSSSHRILGYIQKGVDEGATMLVGSTEPPEAVRQGILGQPNAFHRRRQHDDHRAGGDLRARAGRHSLRGRGRRDPDRQRQRVRPCRKRDVELAGPIARRRPPAARRIHRAQRHRGVRRGHAVRRLQGQRRRTPERPRGIQPVHGSEIGRLPEPSSAQ